MASTELSRTPTTAGNRKTFTYSAWIKRNKLSTGNQRLMASYQSNNDRFEIYFQNSGDILALESIFGGSQTMAVITNRAFRDTSAWYHIVVAVDTTQATASDRVKLYVNGVQETSLSSSTYMAQNQPTSMNDTYIHYVGEGGYNGGGFNFDGLMAHVHWIDGTAYDADTFGSTDSTTGIWKPKTSPSVTYGTNGFFLDFADSSNMGNDVSGNNNDLTVTGTMTQTIDTPSNVFATMNPLDNQIASSTFSHGNNTIQTNTSNYTWNTATLGVSKGKYYWEVKYSANSNSSYYNLIGIADRPTDGSTDVLGRQTDCSNYAYYADTGQSYEKNTLNSYGATYTVGDIIGVALDLDNNKLYYSKNGVWQNSGVPTSGATGTGAVSIDAISSTTTGFYFPASGDYGSTQNATNQHNFGNGYFGTTAVASAGTNSGIGTFEYDVPSGYKALCTKNINAEEYS